MKYVTKPYVCSGCGDRIHMARELRVKVILRSQGNRPSTKDALRNKPQFCPKCFDDIKKDIEIVINGFTFSQRRKSD